MYQNISIPESPFIGERNKAKTTSMVPKRYFGNLNLSIDSIFYVFCCDSFPSILPFSLQTI